MIPLELLNKLLTAIFEFLLYPFSGFDPFWALAFVSFLTGILMVWVFAKVSNQEGIRLIKNRIRGNLLGVRLYQHDVTVVLRLQGRILRDTLTYMGYSLVPMLVLIVPLLIVVVQLNLHFGSRPLRPGEQAIVKSRFSGSSLLQKTISLENSAGVEVETPALRIEQEGEAAWRIRVQQAGAHTLRIRVDGETVEKTLSAGQTWGAVSPLRSRRLSDCLLYPAEAPIRSAAVESVEVRYPPLEISLWGWEIHWMVLFFVLSVLSALVLKGRLGVEL